MAISGFKHSCRLSSDRRMKRIEKKYGNQGYATYLILMESLCDTDDYVLDLSDFLQAELTAEECMADSVTQLFSVIDCIAEVGLIDAEMWAQKKVYSPDLVSDNQAEINVSYRASVAYDYQKHRSFVYQRDGHRCVYCGAHQNLSLDHVVPLSRGGSNDLDNLATACRSCNSQKSNRTPDEWLGGM